MKPVPLDQLESLASEYTAPQLPQASSPPPSVPRGTGGNGAVARCRAYLAKVRPAISGQHGHNRTFHVARLIWNDFALDEGDGWPLLREFNAGCQPPWEEESELRRKWTEAVKRGPSPDGRGCKLHERNGHVSHAVADGTIPSQPPRVSGPAEHPTPDPGGAPQYTPFPYELLPEPVARFIDVASRSLPCDPTYVALPVLATLAGAVGMARVLRIKSRWSEPPILWGAVVGYSGTVKSPAEDLATQPLVDIENELADEYRDAMRQYRTDLAQYRKAKQDAQANDQEFDEPPPVEPVARRVMISDATIESIGLLLECNPKGLLNRRDELSGWFGSFTRYSRASDAPQWLELHRGGLLIIDRKTADRITVRVPMAAVSVIGGIQPDILAKHLTAEARASGLGARLLLVMPPRQEKRWVEEDISEEMANGYAAVVRKLWEMTPEDTSTARCCPREVPLSAEARREFAAFVNRWGKLTAAAERELAAAFAKLEGYAARFALLHHLVGCAVAGGDGLAPVSAASVCAGIRLAEWFAAETERVYAILGEDAATRTRRELSETIGQQFCGRITARALQRYNGRKYRRAEDATAALDELVTAGWGSWEDVTPASGGHTVREFVLCMTHDTRHSGEEAKEPAVRDTRPDGEVESAISQGNSGRVSDVSCVMQADRAADSPPSEGEPDAAAPGRVSCNPPAAAAGDRPPVEPVA